jgi:hypothetical protein
MGKITVTEEPLGLSAPVYEHLQPIVDALIQSGNKLARRDRWGSSKEGFVCYLQESIDFTLVRTMFSLPESIILSEQRDLIACSKTWATIYGSISPRGEW